MAKKNEIAKAHATSIQPVEQIESLIITVRGKQVILDRDLARLYGVETKRLNEQVRRNTERFPEDFMFQLTKEETEFSRSQIATIENEESFLRSQNATIDMRGRHLKYLPYAFTENGIAMLSSVLRSHDRFLCIDDTVYLVGACLKDLGKKWFGFSKMNWTTDQLLSKI